MGTLQFEHKKRLTQFFFNFNLLTPRCLPGIGPCPAPNVVQGYPIVASSNLPFHRFTNPSFNPE
jgi:hypothetical protein